MMLPKRAYYLLIFAAAIIHFCLGYFVHRTDVGLVQLSFGVLWFVFLVQWADQKLSIKQIVVVGMLLRLVYLVAVPELSDDVFRYLWDGKLTLQGVSPYAELPSQFLQNANYESLKALYPRLNSPNYYSIYPPVSQLVFAGSAWIGGGDLEHSIIALRVFSLIADLGSIFVIIQLLSHWRIPSRNVMLYALNPLVIVEFVGNLHTEVFMVCLLLLSVWLLAKQWSTISAVVLGMAVGAKLLPLMFLPFYIKRLGWGRSIVYGLVVFMVVTLFFVPFYTPLLLGNFQDSLRLYFAIFEFNASIYYLIREVGFWVKGYNIIGQTAVWLPRIVLLFILAIAFLNKEKTLSSLPKMMLLAWLVYYAFATTVNPWYIAVFAAFLPFVRYRFGLLWMIMVPLSYHAFGSNGFQENLYLVALEYIPVYVWLMFEFNALRPLEKWWALKRAQVKEKRLLPYLTKGETILEVGAGNGALTKLLEGCGMNMTSLDIEDKSIFNSVDVKVYNGNRFPFADKQFDSCQLITMLHHTTNAAALLTEAKRVSRKVIVMEDVYESVLQKYLTWFTDSVVNWEFYGHPHTNKTDQEWRALFNELNFKVQATESYRFLVFFKQVTYVLETD